MQNSDSKNLAQSLITWSFHWLWMYNTLTFERNVWNVFLEAWYYFCTAFDNLRSLQYEKLNILSERNVRTPSLHRKPKTGSSAELSGASSHNLPKWGLEYIFTLAIHTCRFRTCTYRMPTALCHFLWDMSIHRFWYLHILELFPYWILRDNCAPFMPGFSLWPESPLHHYNEADPYSPVRPQIIVLLPQKSLPDHSRKN